jgi:hypothetical protein
MSKETKDQPGNVNPPVNVAAAQAVASSAASKNVQNTTLPKPERPAFPKIRYITEAAMFEKGNSGPPPVKPEEK